MQTFLTCAKLTLGRRAAAPLRIKRYSSMCVSGSDAGGCDRTVIRRPQNLEEHRGLRTHVQCLTLTIVFSCEMVNL